MASLLSPLASDKCYFGEDGTGHGPRVSLRCGEGTWCIRPSIVGLVGLSSFFFLWFQPIEKAPSFLTANLTLPANDCSVTLVPSRSVSRADLWDLVWITPNSPLLFQSTLRPYLDFDILKQHHLLPGG